MLYEDETKSSEVAEDEDEVGSTLFIYSSVRSTSLLLTHDRATVPATTCTALSGPNVNVDIDVDSNEDN